MNSISRNKIYRQNIKMQSGTILHLSLLRKLSSQSPTTNYRRRFDTFRSAAANTPSGLSRGSHHSAELYPKYPAGEAVLNFVSKSSRSSRENASRSREKGGRFQQWNQNICGWSIDNQSVLEPIMKWKRSVVKTDENRGAGVSRGYKKYVRKYSFCTDGRGKDNVLVNSQKQNVDTSKKILLITPSCTEMQEVPGSRIKFMDSAGQVYQKENILGPAVNSHHSFRSHSISKKAKEARGKVPGPKLSVANIRLDL